MTGAQRPPDEDVPIRHLFTVVKRNEIPRLENVWILVVAAQNCHFDRPSPKRGSVYGKGIGILEPRQNDHIQIIHPTVIAVVADRLDHQLEKRFWA
ncbi:hypothetical protein D2E65_06035 [Mycobacteroides abscessus]|nr:hypothetical protein D2E27_12075 [Mycobacteroides abscessus]RIR65448.1 hypothetical protein D2E62_12320 [Mycobacteroides abscessus]RIR81370.1 hypothetical protein D2E65_06035 [Mycobacteroides abscessus]RIS04920.1 hypothetical protein D2E58_06755 [Mycobacteroides abscessus]